MRLICVVCLLFIRTLDVTSQGKLIDSSTFLKWPVLGSEEISDNGKFIAYKVGTADQPGNLVVRSTAGSWKREFQSPIGDVLFTENSRFLLFTNAGDSVGIFDLEKDSLYYIGFIENYKVSHGKFGQWVAYRIGKGERRLCIVDLFTGVERLYSDVKNYFFSPNGSALIMQSKALKDSTRGESIILHDLLTGKDTEIFNCDEASGFKFDESGSKVAFLVTRKSEGNTSTSLAYYQFGMGIAKILVDSSIPGMRGMIIENNEISFSHEGDKLFFYIREGNERNEGFIGEKSRVKILHYLDDSLEFERRSESYLTAVEIRSPNTIMRLQHSNDQFPILSESGNYVLFQSDFVGSTDDYNWRQSSRPDIYLASTKDSVRKLLIRRLLTYNLYFSPEEKYVIWYDREQRNWFSYNIVHSTLKNITGTIRTPLYYDVDHADYSLPVGLAGWLAKDGAVLIHDRWDVWKVDPEGIQPPVNLTGGYGKRNNICLRYLNCNSGINVFNLNDTLILTAFNLNNKQNGFFKLALNGAVRRLHMENKMYYFTTLRTDMSGATHLFLPLKAKDADVYLVKRMSAAEYPNLFLTKNFDEFVPMTEFAPQSELKWYRCELVHWRLLDGKMAEGLLYKPYDFDPRKRYPIIFYIYEKNADGLNVLIQPRRSDGILNIPWFVSNGYVVFVPNVYYRIGNPGAGVYSSVISATKFISTFPWADIRHMGLQGHSFGGWETNYIVSHSSVFAAAASSAGLSDLIGNYAERLPGSGYYEKGQGRMGTSLWKNVQGYIKNSPIFDAEHVETPLLIMHNKKDYRVNYIQGEQWYNALVRMHKRVWMLSYEGEGHVINGEGNQLDYSARLMQFFDHFLKGKAAPRWITRGSDEDLN